MTIKTTIVSLRPNPFKTAIALLLLWVCLPLQTNSKISMNPDTGLALADSLGSIIGSRFHFHEDWEFTTVKSSDPLIMCEVALKYIPRRNYFLVKTVDKHRGSKIGKGDFVYYVTKASPPLLLDLKISRFPENEKEEKLLELCKDNFNSKNMEEILGKLEENWEHLHVDPLVETGSGLNSLKMIKIEEDDFDFEFLKNYSDRYNSFTNKFNKSVPIECKVPSAEEFKRMLKKEISLRMNKLKNQGLKNIINMYKSDNGGNEENRGDKMESKELNSKIATDNGKEQVESESDPEQENLKNLKFLESLENFFDSYMDEAKSAIFEDDNVELIISTISKLKDFQLFERVFKRMFMKVTNNFLMEDFMYNILQSLKENHCLENLKKEEAFHHAQSGFSNIVNKELNGMVKEAFKAKDIDLRMLGDEMMEKVLKKFKSDTAGEFELSEMEDILYWTGEDSEMTVEKALYLINYEVQNLFSFDLLSKVIFSLFEGGANELSDELTAHALMNPKYSKYKVIEKQDNRILVDMPKLVKHYLVWGEIESNYLSDRVTVPVFVAENESKSESE